MCGVLLVLMVVDLLVWWLELLWIRWCSGSRWLADFLGGGSPVMGCDLRGL